MSCLSLIYSISPVEQNHIMFKSETLAGSSTLWRWWCFMQNLPFVSLKAICHTNHFIWLFHAKSRFKCILCLKTKAAGSIWFKDKLDAEPIQKLLERFALSYFMHSRPNTLINMQRSSWKFYQRASPSDRMSQFNHEYCL